MKTFQDIIPHFAPSKIPNFTEVENRKNDLADYSSLRQQQLVTSMKNLASAITEQESLALGEMTQSTRPWALLDHSVNPMERDPVAKLGSLRAAYDHLSNLQEYQEAAAIVEWLEARVREAEVTTLAARLAIEEKRSALREAKASALRKAAKSAEISKAAEELEALEKEHSGLVKIITE